VHACYGVGLYKFNTSSVCPLSVVLAGRRPTVYSYSYSNRQLPCCQKRARSNIMWSHE